MPTPVTLTSQEALTKALELKDAFIERLRARGKTELADDIAAMPPMDAVNVLRDAGKRYMASHSQTNGGA